MDRRRFELQVEAVLVVYRAQRRQQDGEVLDIVRRRGHEILTGLDPHADGDPEREGQLAAARQELDALPETA